MRGYERATIGPKGTPSQTYTTDVPRDSAGNPLSTSGGYVYDPVSQKFVTHDTTDNMDSYGGNVLVEGGVELIFPLWFIKDTRSLRTSLFLDSGNVYDTSCGENQVDCYRVDLKQLRSSYGFGLTWMSAMGPLTFSLAQPLNETSRDDTKVFQFSIGTGF